MNINTIKNKLQTNTYLSSSENFFSKNNQPNILYKTNYVINKKIKIGKNMSRKDKIKREYIISIDYMFNKKKEKLESKQSKILNKTKLTEASSKEKTKNNSFNTNNTYSNTNNNINQNSNYNAAYINVEINNSRDKEISKTESNLDNYNNIDDINKNSKKIKSKALNNFSLGNIKLYNSDIKDLDFPHEYYSLTDKISEMEKTKKKLFDSSNKFYFHTKERHIINKIKQIKNKDIEKELKQLGYDFSDNKKLNIYSELKRLPTKICFGKGISSMKDEEEDKEIYENKFLKNLETKNKENQINANNFHKLIKKGFRGSRKNISKYDAAMENKLIINSNSTKRYKKQNTIITGKNLYPLLKEKKIVKNILPKKSDYNTQFTIKDVINNELHPLYRYQKKNLAFHSGLISHEISYLFVKHFALGNMADKKKDFINKKLDQEFNILAKFLLEKDKDYSQSKKKLSINEINAIERRKYLLQKFEGAIKRSFYQFRRMKINIREYLEITKNNIPVEYNEGIYLFKAIKDGDIDNIVRIIKSNYNYALFKDEFGQTAMHICAKRNIYQIIHLLTSRLGDIDAQDIYGRTPLMCATENKHMETICVLLFYYADPSIVDNEGKKAIDYIKVGKKVNETDEYKLRRALSFVTLTHLFNRMMVNEKDFDTFMKNSLNHLFKQELDMNYEEWLKVNEELTSDGDEKKYKKLKLNIK